MSRIYLLALLPLSLLGQTPQIANTNPQPVWNQNSKWVDGIGTGYQPSCANSACTGATFDIGLGTCFDSSMTRHVTSSVTVLTLTSSATNYIGLSQSSCSITSNTSGYGTTEIPLATVIVGSSNITSFTDDRTWFITNIIGGNFATIPGVQLNSYTTCPDTSGSGTAQSCNTTPTFSPATNSCVWYTTTTTNSGTGLTTNVNSLGAKSVAIPGASGWTTTLTASIIPANEPLELCYDGTKWNVMQTGTSASGGSSVSVNGSSVSSPNFNGTTPAAGSNNLNVTWQSSGSSVSAEVPAATNSTLGLIETITCSSHNWLSSIASGTGVPACTQPGFSDLSGNISTSQMNSGTSASSATFWRGDGTWSAPGSAGAGTNTHWRPYTNTATGTGANLIARMSGNSVQTVSTTDSATTTRIAGICTTQNGGTCGSTGTAYITTSGPVLCQFDGATTIGDSVNWSTTSNGECHDTGGINNIGIGTRYCIGTVESTNASSGTYVVDLGECGGTNDGGTGLDAFEFYPNWTSMPVQSFMVMTNGPNSSSEQVHLIEALHLCFDSSGGGSGGQGCIWAVGSGATKGLVINPDFSGNGYSLSLQGGEYSHIENAGTLSGGYSFSMNLGMIGEYTANGNATISNPQNLNAGQMFLLHLCEDATGGHTWSWGTSFVNPPSPSTAANSCTAPTGSPITFLFLAIDTTHIFTVGQF